MKGAGKMNTKPLIDLTYKEGEDGMLYPNLQVSEDERHDLTEVGKFGKLWKEYMMEQHPHRLSELIAEGRLNGVITEVDEEAESRKEALIQELLKAQPMSKTEDTLERAAHMQMITSTAEEIIMNEVSLKVR